MRFKNPTPLAQGDRVRVVLPPDTSSGIAFHDGRAGTVSGLGGRGDLIAVALDDPVPGTQRQWHAEYPPHWLTPMYGPWRRLWDEFWPIARWGVWPASYALVLRLGFELGTRA